MKRKIRNEKVRKHSSRRIRTTTSANRTNRTRLTVFRSAKHIYAQLIDPETGRTIGIVSTRSKQIAGDSGGGNIEAAKRVGQAVAELAKKKKISEVVFNRNGFLFHGRVKALADAAREAGLQF